VTDTPNASISSRVSSFLREHYPTVIPMAVALIVCAVVLSTYPTLPAIHDALAYTRTAQRLLSSGFYSYGGEAQPNATQTPGYPFFLAAVFAVVRRGTSEGDWARAAKPLLTFVQVLLALGIVGCLAQCGRMLGGRRVGLVAGLFAAAYLPYAWATAVALSELLGALLITVELMVALYLTAPGKPPRMRTFALLGVLAAFVALVRPAYLPWAAIPLLFVAFQRSLSWRRLAVGIALCALAFMLVMLPWWVRNSVTLHRVVLLNSNSADTMLDSLGGREFTDTEQQISDQAEAVGKDGHMAVALTRMRQEWAASPIQFLSRRTTQAVSAAALPWSPYVDVYWEQYNHYDVERIDYGVLPIPPPAFLLPLEVAMYRYQLLLLGAAFVGLFYVRRSPRLLLAASLPLYAIAAHYFTWFIGRYFFPAMGGVILLAAAGCVGVFISARRWLTRRVGGSAKTSQATPRRA